MPLEILMWELTGYTVFQIRQVERNRIRVIFVPSRGTNPEEGRDRVYSQFSGYFARHGLEHVIRLEVEPRQEVERSATSGKVRQIASLVGPPPDLEGRLTYRR